MRGFGDVKEARIVKWDDYGRRAPGGSWITQDLRSGLPHYQP